MEEKMYQAQNDPVEFHVNQDQGQIPAAQPADTSQIPVAEPAVKPKGDEFQCPKCSKVFVVALTKRPLHIRCPYCGLEGMID